MEGHIKCVGCGEYIVPGLITEMIHYVQCFGEEKYDKMLRLGDLYRRKFISAYQLEQELDELLEKEKPVDLGSFERRYPANSQLIPEGYVKCKVCGDIIGQGIIPMVRHDAECGGKENFDKMEAFGKRYRNKEITAEEFKAAAREIYGIDATASPLLLAHIEDFLKL